jgi:2-(1,2-epoxy-1,2-dihydrophenyl)acetyl-CoA isomerase
MLTTELDDGVATITLDRPERLNALTWELMDRLREAIHTLGQDPATRVLVITGAGRAFSSGADLLGVAGADDLVQEIDHGMTHSVTPLCEAIVAAPVPVVAAVNGPCAGAGVGIALLADVAVASRSAYFLVPQVSALGIVPDAGATWALPRQAGRARALGMSLLGDRIPAQQAADWGLIWACVDDDAFAAEVATVAGRLAATDAGAIVATRALIDAGGDLTTQLAHEAREQVERFRQAVVRTSVDGFAQRSGGTTRP